MKPAGIDGLGAVRPPNIDVSSGRLQPKCRILPHSGCGMHRHHSEIEGSHQSVVSRIVGQSGPADIPIRASAEHPRPRGATPIPRRPIDFPREIHHSAAVAGLGQPSPRPGQPSDVPREISDDQSAIASGRQPAKASGVGGAVALSSLDAARDLGQPTRGIEAESNRSRHEEAIHVDRDAPLRTGCAEPGHPSSRTSRATASGSAPVPPYAETAKSAAVTTAVEAASRTREISSFAARLPIANRIVGATMITVAKATTAGRRRRRSASEPTRRTMSSPPPRSSPTGRRVSTRPAPFAALAVAESLQTRPTASQRRT